MSDEIKKPHNAIEFLTMAEEVMHAYPDGKGVPLDLIKVLYACGDLPEVKDDPQHNDETRAQFDRCQKLLRSVFKKRIRNEL